MVIAHTRDLIEFASCEWVGRFKLPLPLTDRRHPVAGSELADGGTLQLLHRLWIRALSDCHTDLRLCVPFHVRLRGASIRLTPSQEQLRAWDRVALIHDCKGE